MMQCILPIYRGGAASMAIRPPRAAEKLWSKRSLESKAILISINGLSRFKNQKGTAGLGLFPKILVFD